eukprot:scaffold29533_cov19-Tisochrysis_lutea.AAC.8
MWEEHSKEGGAFQMDFQADTCVFPPMQRVAFTSSLRLVRTAAPYCLHAAWSPDVDREMVVLQVGLQLWFRGRDRQEQEDATGTVTEQKMVGVQVLLHFTRELSYHEGLCATGSLRWTCGCEDPSTLTVPGQKEP